TVNLVADTSAPQILSMDPLGESIRRQGLQTIDIRFSKSLDPSTVTSGTFQLQTTAGTVIAPTSVQLRAEDRRVALTSGPLPSGSYRLVIAAAAVTDRAGHPLGTTNDVSPFTLVPATIAWINPAGGFWDDPHNWDAGHVPGPTDNVAIGVPGNVPIVY